MKEVCQKGGQTVDCSKGVVPWVGELISGISDTGMEEGPLVRRRTAGMEEKLKTIDMPEE